MKNALIAMMFAVALGCTASPTAAQTVPQKQRNHSQNEIAQRNVVIAANESQDATGKWTEPASTTVTVTSTPLHVESRRKKHWADSSSNRPSKDDWTRCLQNDKCDPKNLFNNKWDRVFGPAYDFGN